MNFNTPISYSLGSLSITKTITKEMEAWKKADKVVRLWQGNSTLWTDSDEDQWMGWLDVSSTINSLTDIESLVKNITDLAYQDVVLLGMGGSSLCAELFARIFGKMENYPRLQVLDSTDPVQILSLANSIDLRKTLFIVASKSGTTLEPLILKKYFYSRLQEKLEQRNLGEHFLAITDPGTLLEKTAKDEHFKAIFYGVPSIAGRFSALSNFGIVPLALMGIDVKKFLSNAEKMRKACYKRCVLQENPGIALGIILGVCAKKGKDKLTLLISSEINALGDWIVQLIAESTGKNGKGIIPIHQEPLTNLEAYSSDRLFIHIRLRGCSDTSQDKIMTQLEEQGHPVVRLEVADKMTLGAEFYRWEVATVVASSILGIHPFNQPDVEASKVRAKQLTLQIRQKRERLLLSSPICFEQGIQLFTDKNNADALSQLIEKDIYNGISAYLKAHLSRGNSGDYVNLSAFITRREEHIELLQIIRHLIQDRVKLATCFDFGPRFLHSTGQLHKGGPNKGLFIQITSDSSQDLQVPTKEYSFGLVIAMQAHADFEVLAQLERRFLRIHLGTEVTENLQKLVQILQII